MASRDNSFAELRKRALAGAALLALFCALAAGGVWHYDKPGTEAACPVCQVAHMPVTAPVAPPVLVGLCAVALRAPQSGTILYSSPELPRASSRAPPSQS
ncbi:MAG: hypothetical protein ACLP1Y_04995 [Candidatus Acidiferrales bacterium]